jgi:hypothetical protein
MLGPYISASNRPTLAPLARRLSAKLTLTVDLPTPPFPDATAITFLTSAMVIQTRVIIGPAFWTQIFF